MTISLACIILSPVGTDIPASTSLIPTPPLSGSPETLPSTQLPPIVLTPGPFYTATSPLIQLPPPTLTRVPNTPAALPSDTPFPEKQLHTVTNDAGSITATIPTVWTDVRSLTWKNEHNVVIGHMLMASTDVDAYLRWEVEGVSISVTRNLGMGYLQLLEKDYAKYRTICDDPYLTIWDFENNLYQGQNFVLDNCGGVKGGWLSVMVVVPLGGAPTYVAEVLGYDMPPTYGDTFRDIIMRFEVVPEKLP
jgi:hypothetical protein